MLPWLIISAIGFVCNVIHFLSSLVNVVSQGFGAIIVTFFLGFLIIGKVLSDTYIGFFMYNFLFLKVYKP